VKADDPTSRHPTTQVPVPPELSPSEARAARLTSSNRRMVPVSLAIAALLGAVGVLLFRDRGTDSPGDNPPVVTVPPGTVTPPPEHTQQTAPPQVTPPANTTVATPPPTPNPATPVNPPVTPEPTAKPPEVVQVETPKPPVNKPRPVNSGSRAAQQELLNSVDRLRRDMEGLIQSGQIKDAAAARSMFERIRKGATSADSAEDRRGVEFMMNNFERTYLKRK
jgi:outer membrane biosynthesis protein TonB